MACVARFENGSATAWGDSSWGGDLTDTDNDRVVDLSANVVDISCGNYACVARFTATTTTPGPTQFPTSRPSTSPTASPTYDTAVIDEAKVAYDAVLAKYNCSAGAPAPVFAAKAGATAAKGELETVFAAYKVTVRDHMKVLLSDKQWEEYDAKVVLSKFQGDQILFGECKRKIRSLRKAAEIQAANE
jgi:hypothetical protein